jgi:hypothetical protein
MHSSMRFTRAALLALLLLAPARADAQCDPYSSETPVAIPAALRLKKTCGNGRIDEYATSCTRVTSGGCGLTPKSTQSCLKTREICDGKSLDGQTCKTNGYAAGTLRCTAGCDDFRYDACKICPPGTTCSERLVRESQFEDLTLFAQGTDVRAYWTNGKALVTAGIDKKGALGREKTVAKVASLRLVPVQVGDSALALTGPMEHPALTIVDAKGAITNVALPGQSGMLHLPIVPVEGARLALVVVGMPFQSPHVLLVDERGAPTQLTSLYAQNVHRRIAAMPIAAGTHRVRWATFDDQLVAEPGDFLMVMFDGHPWLSIVRNGVATNPWPKGPKSLGSQAIESAEVVLDGKLVMSFGQLEDVALGAKHPLLRPSNAGLTRVFGDIAYDSSAVAVARTSAVEVQVVRVRPPGSPERFEYGKGPRHILAISVRTP